MTESSVHLVLVAGEPSGDRLGAALIADLRQRVSLRLTGVGGPLMGAKGLKSLFDMGELSVMGFADVIKALPRLLWRVHYITRAALKACPDAIVLIDSQVFSTLVARRLRKAGYRGPIFLYVSPSVWAWKPERAAKLAPVFDEILAVLPFEPRVMSELGGPLTTYVGHPAEHLIQPNPPTRETRHTLVLLPGSRAGELSRHLPLFAEIVAGMASNPAITHYALPTLPRWRDRLLSETASWPVDVDVVTGSAEREIAFAGAAAAIASAGTVTLELALMDVPMIGVYVPDRLQMRAFKRWGKPRIALPNIILDQDLVPEIEPGPDLARQAGAALTELLTNPEAAARQRAGFTEIRQQILIGLPETGRQNAADRILHHLRTQ